MSMDLRVFYEPPSKSIRVSSKSNSIHFIPVSIAKLANHLILDMSDLDNSQISIVRKTISLITEEWYDGPKALIVWGRHTIEDNNFSIDNKENSEAMNSHLRIFVLFLLGFV